MEEVKTFYISNKGCDETGDGSYDKPFKSLIKINWKITPNIIFLPGIHDIDPITIKSLKTVVISSFKGNKKETIITSSSRKDLFTVEKNTKVHFKNLTFEKNKSSSIIENHGTATITNVDFLSNEVYNRLTFKGIINNDGTMNLKDVIVKGNIGVYGVVNNKGDINVNDCKFLKNFSQLGGAIYSSGVLDVKDTCFDENGVKGIPITNNTKAIKVKDNYGLGGTLYNSGNSKLTNVNISRSYIKDGQNNENQKGGAIFNKQDLTIKSSSIKNCDFFGHSTIYNEKNLYFEDSEISSNKASEFSGAIGNFKTATIKHATIINNKSKKGGAIYNKDNLNIISSYLNKNSSDNEGGAIYNYEGKISIFNTEINNNSSLNGGAIYNTKENKITIRASELNDNKSSLNGGAIYNNGNLFIYLSELKNNSTNLDYTNNSEKYGGAIYNNSGRLKIINTELEENNAVFGGVIGIKNGRLSITNSNIKNNRSIKEGGVISVLKKSTKTEVIIEIDTTFITHNTSDTKAPVLYDETKLQRRSKITITNSNINNNTSPLNNDYLIYTSGHTQIIDTNICYNKVGVLYCNSQTSLEKCRISHNQVNSDIIYVKTEGNLKIFKTCIIKNIANDTIFVSLNSILNIKASTLYNKSRYEIYNQKEGNITIPTPPNPPVDRSIKTDLIKPIKNNVKCDENWWGTQTIPTTKVFNCTIKTFRECFPKKCP